MGRGGPTLPHHSSANLHLQPESSLFIDEYLHAPLAFHDQWLVSHVVRSDSRCLCSSLLHVHDSMDLSVRVIRLQLIACADGFM